MNSGLAGALAAALVFAPQAGRADFFDEYLRDPQDGQLDASRYLAEVPLGFLPVPSIITEPALGYGLALGALFFHESPEQRRQRTEQGVLLPENISVAGGAATDNGTWGLAAGHMGFWRQDSLRYRGLVAYGSINLEFYSLPGVGDLPRPIELALDGPFLFQDLKIRLPGTNLFVGARQLYRRLDAGFASDPNLGLLPPPVLDYFASEFGGDTSTSGLGVVADFDSRDNPFNPETGYFYSGNYTVFDEAIGSDVDYASFNVTALNYWRLAERLNLGARLQLDGIEADAGERLPPYVPPYIKLRGVPAARYQGERVVVAEIQLDYRIDARWKAGVFTGAGRAADAFDELDDAEHVHNVGAGFRYLVARRYGFIMGLDVARGPDETAVYVQAGSTWQ